MDKRQFIAGAGAAMLAGPALAQGAQNQVNWRFDNLTSIGGVPARADGAPQLIETGAGKAVLFDGVKDGLFIETNPLAGFAQFTFEVIFRPDGGNYAQRWFHVATTDPKTGTDSLPGGTSDPNPRFMFEVRIEKNGGWALDAFTNGEGYNAPLLFEDKTHPVGKWHTVAQSFDGTTYSSYVNGEVQGSVPLAFKPHGPGHCMVGTRMNKVNYFKGAVYAARFTPHALAPSQFLKIPAAMQRA